MTTLKLLPHSEHWLVQGEKYIKINPSGQELHHLTLHFQFFSARLLCNFTKKTFSSRSHLYYSKILQGKPCTPIPRTYTKHPPTSKIFAKTCKNEALKRQCDSHSYNLNSTCMTFVAQSYTTFLSWSSAASSAWEKVRHLLSRRSIFYFISFFLQFLAPGFVYCRLFKSVLIYFPLAFSLALLLLLNTSGAGLVALLCRCCLYSGWRVEALGDEGQGGPIFP